MTEVINFGLQRFIQKYLVEFFNENFFSKDINEIVSEYEEILLATLGVAPGNQHIRDLHELGYLPLAIYALPEGTPTPLRVPMVTVRNTDNRFFWLTNYIETLMSCELWGPSTVATLAWEYKKVLSAYALKTVGNLDFVPFQGHDFSMRGMGCLEHAALLGMGHLLSFVGTDTIPAIQEVMNYYPDSQPGLIGTSIPATEHSIQCAYGDDMEYFDKLITKVHPAGFVSIVSDGYDFWDVVGRVLPTLKDKIMARDGKVVIRPDSGDPVKIICGDAAGKTDLERKGAVEALWDIFGGTVSDQGYKILDSHIGLIYGDAITLDRCKQICQKLKDKGFASINCVFGIGSYSYYYNTRDTFGFAMKATLVRINGEEIQIQKNPKTDDGTKISAKGAVVVKRDHDGVLQYKDELSLMKAVCEPGNELQIVFHNGDTPNKQSLAEIRTRLNSFLPKV